MKNFGFRTLDVPILVRKDFKRRSFRINPMFELQKQINYFENENNTQNMFEKVEIYAFQHKSFEYSYTNLEISNIRCSILSSKDFKVD